MCRFRILPALLVSLMVKEAKVLFVSAAVLPVFFLSLMTGISEVGASDVKYPPLQTPPIILEASIVLQKDVLTGTNYKVEQKVKNDGFINSYKLDTDYGLFPVESTELLLERINELMALRHMEELKGTSAFGDALKESAKAPYYTAKGLVTEPVDTVSGIATGVGRWFSDVGRSITSSDPHQENVLKTAVGYASIKRKYAYEYGIDPYTRFGPVQKRLSEISQAALAGGIAPKVAFGLINKPVGTVLRVSATTDSMRKLVRDKSPAELEKINKAKLEAMGIPESVVKHFLRNPHYNPQEETLLVGFLETMKGVKGLDKFVASAAQANEESVARFMRLKAEMYAGYHAHVRAVKQIIEVSGSPTVQNKDGVLVILAPLDYIAWTGALFQKESVISKDIGKLSGVTGKELWIEGAVDPVARKALESRGWKVKGNVKDELIRK